MQRENPFPRTKLPQQERARKDKLTEATSRLALDHRGLGLYISVHVSVGPQGDKPKERNLVREQLLRVQQENHPRELVDLVAAHSSCRKVMLHHSSSQRT